MLSGTDVSLAHDGRPGGSRWYGWWRGDCSICRGRPLRRHAFRTSDRELDGVFSRLVRELNQINSVFDGLSCNRNEAYDLAR